MRDYRIFLPRLRLVKVIVGRDFGEELELLDGAKTCDIVISNASDELETGQPVEVVPNALGP